VPSNVYARTFTDKEVKRLSPQGLYYLTEDDLRNMTPTQLRILDSEFGTDTPVLLRYTFPEFYASLPAEYYDEFWRVFDEDAFDSAVKGGYLPNESPFVYCNDKRVTSAFIVEGRAFVDFGFFLDAMDIEYSFNEEDRKLTVPEKFTNIVGTPKFLLDNGDVVEFENWICYFEGLEYPLFNLRVLSTILGLDVDFHDTSKSILLYTSDFDRSESE
jgi:hypothetical protein